MYVVGNEMQSMNVQYTCMLDTRHERSTHAVKQKQRREAETGVRAYRRGWYGPREESRRKVREGE